MGGDSLRFAELRRRTVEKKQSQRSYEKELSCYCMKIKKRPKTLDSRILCYVMLTFKLVELRSKVQEQLVFQKTNIHTMASCDAKNVVKSQCHKIMTTAGKLLQRNNFEFIF